MQDIGCELQRDFLVADVLVTDGGTAKGFWKEGVGCKELADDPPLRDTAIRAGLQEFEGGEGSVEYHFLQFIKNPWWCPKAKPDPGLQWRSLCRTDEAKRFVSSLPDEVSSGNVDHAVVQADQMRAQLREQLHFMVTRVLGWPFALPSTGTESAAAPYDNTRSKGHTSPPPPPCVRGASSAGALHCSQPGCLRCLSGQLPPFDIGTSSARSSLADTGPRHTPAGLIRQHGENTCYVNTTLQACLLLPHLTARCPSLARSLAALTAALTRCPHCPHPSPCRCCLRTQSS